MPDPSPKAGKAVPVLVAALLCDSAVADPTTGKKNLIGIFDKIWAGSFPTGRPLSFYGKMTDAEGSYSLKVQIVHADKNKRIGKVSGEVGVANRLDAFDFVISFPPVLFEDPGRYEFQVFMNDVYVGRAVLDAQLGPPKP